jgi:hypothetical protein
LKSWRQGLTDTCQKAENLHSATKTQKHQSPPIVLVLYGALESWWQDLTDTCKKAEHIYSATKTQKH